MFFRFVIGVVVLTTWVVFTDPTSVGKLAARTHKAYTAEMLK